MDNDTPFSGWAILELMGHRRLAGLVSEQTFAGTTFVRLDVPDGATQFYNPSAVYCITPTSEQLARAVAARDRPAPVQRFELTPAEPKDDDDIPF